MTAGPTVLWYLTRGGAGVVTLSSIS